MELVEDWEDTDIERDMDVRWAAVRLEPKLELALDMVAEWFE